jgi:GT2 family glycosyltransferase
VRPACRNVSPVHVCVILALNGADGGNAFVAQRVAADATAAGAALIYAPYGAGAPHATAAAAANAAARDAGGDVLVFVNAAEPLGADWLPRLCAALDAPDAGVVGPRVVFDGGASELCGYIVFTAPYTLRGFAFQPISGVRALLAFDVLPSDVLATSRALFDELGGFTDAFGAELDAFDYCLRVQERGRRVLIEPAAVVGHRAPSIAAEDARLQPYRERAFSERWRERIEPHENFWPELIGSFGRGEFYEDGISLERAALPKITVLVHGDVEPAPDFAARLFGSRYAPAEVVWAARTPAPARCRAVNDAFAVARELTEVRGTDLIAFVRTDTQLAADWLNELLNTIGRLPDTVASTVVAPPAPRALPATADARCTLVAPRLIPQHLRIEPQASFDAAVATWLAAAVDAGRTIAPLTRTATVLPAPVDLIPAASEPLVRPAPADVFVSIVMLSWNAPEFTELAVASIRANTSIAHEIIIVDNGSDADTRERIARIANVRVMWNAVNTGFAFGCNQGLAAALGTHAVLLNNDVIVTAGWLDALLAVQHTNPAVGCSAPRTNSIAGPQQIDAVPYHDLDGLPAYAAARARAERGRWTRQARVVGFCMCISRRVIDEIGGLDPRYGTGNFEDDDYCMRMRAAGYDIAVCEDAFIHHFGSATFKRNAVDYRATIERNKSIFAARWNVTYAGDAYDARQALQRGFVRARDFVPLPAPEGVGADWLRPA